MSVRSRALALAALCLAVVIVASTGEAPGAGSGPTARAGMNVDTTLVPGVLLAGDSVPIVDLAAEGVDSLLPESVGFGIGEELLYSVQYGIVTAGEATLEVRNIALIDGKPCYYIVSDARTNDVFSVFYRVRDRFVSLLDTTDLVSLRYQKHLREGGHKSDRKVEFDQKQHKAYYDGKEIPIAPRTQDVLSALYYVRTLPLRVGQSIAIANHTDGRNYPLVVRVLGEERVTVEAGTFDCLIVEPLLRYPGVFTQKGRMKVWLTNDRYKIPVLVKSKVIIGEVSAVLKKYQLAEKFRNVD